MEEYDEVGILLKDKQGVKISNVVMGALFGSDCNVLRGELVIRIPEKPHKEGQPPHNYQTVYTDQPATFYDETNISPLLGNQPLLLAAVKSNEERYQLFVSGKMDWGSTLKINDPVQVSLKHPQPSDTAATLKATAVIHYVGPVTGVNGIMFGIEIVDPHFFGQGTTDGTLQGGRYFICKDGNGMFVSLDKLSQLPTGGHAPPRPPKQQPAAQSAVQPAAKSGGKRKKKAYRFKIQDRVVAFNKYGVPIHGTVRWVGPYALLDEKKQPFNVAAVGVETDVKVLGNEMESCLPPKHHYFSTGKNNGKLFVREEEVMLETDFGTDTQPPPATQATHTLLKTRRPATHESQKDHTHPPLGVLVSKPQETGRSLGKGSYGEVVEVRVSGWLCAAKKLHGIFSAHDVPPAEKAAMVERFEKECHRVLQLKHANIVEVIGVHFDRATKLPTLVMELMDTSLCSYLEKNLSPSVTLTTKYSILLDVASGLVYLHTLPPPLGPIVHRDLTANNILLSGQGDVMVAKIADLGQAKNDPLYVSRRQTLSKVPGNEAHMPPEAWFDNPQYNSSLDIFSFGVVMLHTLSHEWPNPLGRLVSATEVRLEVDRRKPYLDKIGNSVLRPLIMMCLGQEPKDRPATSEVFHILSSCMGKQSVLAGVEVGSHVQLIQDLSCTGVIRWMGHLPEIHGYIAGVELDAPMVGCHDGEWKGNSYFACIPGRAFFCPITSLQHLTIHDNIHQQSNAGVIPDYDIVKLGVGPGGPVVHRVPPETTAVTGLYTHTAPSFDHQQQMYDTSNDLYGSGPNLQKQSSAPSVPPVPEVPEGAVTQPPHPTPVLMTQGNQDSAPHALPTADTHRKERPTPAPRLQSKSKAQSVDQVEPGSREGGLGKMKSSASGSNLVEMERQSRMEATQNLGESHLNRSPSGSPNSTRRSSRDRLTHEEWNPPALSPPSSPGVPPAVPLPSHSPVKPRMLPPKSQSVDVERQGKREVTRFSSGSNLLTGKSKPPKAASQADYQEPETPVVGIPITEMMKKTRIGQTKPCDADTMTAESSAQNELCTSDQDTNRDNGQDMNRDRSQDMGRHVSQDRSSKEESGDSNKDSSGDGRVPRLPTPLLTALKTTPITSPTTAVAEHSSTSKPDENNLDFGGDGTAALRQVQRERANAGYSRKRDKLQTPEDKTSFREKPTDDGVTKQWEIENELDLTTELGQKFSINVSETWECPYCTQINPTSLSSCDVCYTNRDSLV